MLKLVSIAAIVAVSATAANAIDLSNSRLSANIENRRSYEGAQALPTSPVDSAIDTSALAKMFNDVCTSKAVKSKKLETACTMQEMPKPLKNGKAFRASGIGGEVNVIYNNLELINR